MTITDAMKDAGYQVWAWSSSPPHERCAEIYCAMNAAAQRIEARSDETVQPAQSERREPGPKDAPNT